MNVDSTIVNIDIRSDINHNKVLVVSSIYATSHVL